MGFGKVFASKLAIAEQDRLITGLTQTVLETAKPLQVILFGSAARREMTTASDLDIVVIVESADEVKSTERALNQLSRILDWPVDVLVIDGDRFQQQASLGGVYAVARDEGIILIGAQNRS